MPRAVEVVMEILERRRIRWEDMIEREVQSLMARNGTTGQGVLAISNLPRSAMAQ
jgi:hypothetical protein